MINFNKQKNNNGFALLFSVLLSSLLLAIGLSIFNITLKELALSTATARSVSAFYAADSGRECALYFDQIKGSIKTVISGSTGDTIKCNGVKVADVTDGYNGSEPVITNFSFFSVDVSDGPGAEVKITKRLSDGNNPCINNDGAICTTIEATGWDTTGGDRAERAIKQEY
jgi:hypothetical protein